MLIRLYAGIGTLACLATCTPAPTVSSQLQHAMERSAPGDLVRLSDFTDFEWDSFVALGPYTTQESADAALGFPWAGFDRFDLATSNSFSLLVFTNKGSVVHAEKHPRCKPDFAQEVLRRPLSPSGAVFSIDRGDYCAVARAAA